MKIDNLERFQTKMSILPVSVRDALKKAISTGAEEIVDLMQRTVAVGAYTGGGDLRRSIVWRWGDEARIPFSQTMGTYGRTALSAVITAGNTEVRYAHLVEWGARPHPAGGKYTGHQHPGAPAQPFFYPSWRIGKKRSTSRIARTINRAIKDAAR